MSEEIKREMKGECASKVLVRFEEKIRDIERFDYERFVIFTQEIKQETGCKGKELYHPLRIALTAQSSGLDLDKFIPLVEEGSRLDMPRPILNCAQRISKMMGSLSSAESDRKRSRKHEG
jgi:glutamyl/glutaminyl-tRNA synthetase